ncbi:ATP-binding sensor histidine kinase [Oscillatoria sp. FACHB-1406]|uniref:trifunctional serine/threonine-protein kinase/ATP-binding protein/sensor histidine kinase n=1 Tax=Oscillatoria sp. FACHB-1406 TaxID=2692846 RepID=UPI0016838D91|nr:ATP-binding sensor histidine kinase [Oscillatoria sp. FACHB-1406]MBD2579580.1 AAA family ATPase [Oscillatoria sp. FACHB-1406]
MTPLTGDTTTLPTLPGYVLTEQLYTGSRTLVYRAKQLSGLRPVVIKVLRQTYPSFNEIVQFRNQYAIACNLAIEGIVRPISLEPWQNGYALVMEDNGSISLAQYARSQKLDWINVLNIAIQLADILHDLHEQRTIHKDIKPANILINPETQQIKLIDFSIATLLPKENQELQNPHLLEGTLAYISPEQTGRMNRCIDYRTDFYSLGVSLYELLTGQLPFTEKDPLELVHAHIAKNPIPPHQIAPQIPATVSGIVVKLMAKNAEERYQSALGLKDDLEQCLQQWQETGSITEFELGQGDICDRFIIPEKLYGREAEVAQLRAAFARVAVGASEMMLVAGFSGIGKTAVINEVHKPITRQHGYFIKGKFDQFNRNIPFSAFVYAFKDLMRQLLADSDAKIAQWRNQILEAVGDNGQVLIEVIPELTGSAAQNRFNSVFQKFIEVFARPEHPIVIFLDDLQWADLASLRLMKLLMQDIRCLLLLGAYRDREVSPTHPLMLMVEELKQGGHIVNTITLTPLEQRVINQLVADTLRCSPSLVMPLTEIINAKTQGNPFFTTQFLKALYDERHLTFKCAPRGNRFETRGYWECDITHLKTLTLSSDVVEFMGQQLKKISPCSQESLKIAACIGAQFDLATLAIVLEKNKAEVALGLWEALQEGLILPQSEIYKFYASYEEGEAQSEPHQNITYRFFHDRVQQAAYSLIPEAERAQTHYRIGQLLLAKIPPEQQEEQIFELVNQLNAGKDSIEEQASRDRLAELNAIATRRARTSTAYNAGRRYAEIGIGLLGENAWERQYDLTLKLHNLAAELTSLCGDYEAMEALILTVLEKTKTLLDRIEVYLTQIQATISRNLLVEALALGLDILEQLGLMVPKLPTEAEIGREVAEIAQLIGDRDIEDLVNIPLTTDRHQIAIAKVAKMIFGITFFINPNCHIFILASAVKASIKHGNTFESPMSYGSYGRFVCISLKDIETGVKFGNLGYKLAEKFGIKEIKPELFITLTASLIHRKCHIRKILPLNREGYTLALEVGNSEYLAYNALNYFGASFWAGLPLNALEQEARTHRSNAMHLMGFWLVQWQCILNLLGFSENPTILSGEVYQESEIIAENPDSFKLMESCHIYLLKLMLGYLFRDLKSLKSLNKWGRNLSFIIGTVAEPAFYFYESLAILSELLPSEVGNSEQWQQVEQNQATLQQFWTKYAPMNYQHKFDLVEAEKSRVLDRKLEAIELYDKAIAGARENEYIQEEAIANELAAKFYLAWGKERIAASYMQEAYYCYARWGAKAKTDDLERRYPILLYPILHSASQPLNLLDTLATLATPKIGLQTSTNSITRSSSSSLNNTLDFAAVIRAAQSISSPLKLEESIAQLTEIMLQNAGAERCALILPDRAGEWHVEAVATLQSTQLNSQALEGYNELPVKLIQYVKNTLEAIALDALADNLPVIDPYFERHHPQSLLVQPILDRGNLVGLLYLENRLARGAFTTERLLVLNFLCSQAAISLENARLYQEAQDYTQQLEQSQLQIVQSEKMASLGNLVAGVAHEINNPIGFLNGSLSNTRDYIQDVLSHLELYQECVPSPPAAVLENAEDIDLGFVVEDLPKLLEAMRGAIDRIKSISNSLRTFSRADSEHPVTADLHAGLDSTLLILKYRLKANEQRPAISVIKNYDRIPAVECFPGQLNQVFMNILANAIDALDEVAQKRGYLELEVHPQKIEVCTQLNREQNKVEIRIKDNGDGIAEELQERIFEHLFTTKGVGKGTGLGLAIARKIIEEQHGGTLTCNSVLGQGTEFTMEIPLQP